MNTGNVPSRDEIARSMNQLPSKLEHLLEECVGTAPYFVPDYVTFKLKAAELVKLFSKYSDAMFHAGSYSDAWRAAVRVFAAKKMEYERLLSGKSEQDLQSGDAEAIDVFMRFKLLFGFFGYTEQEYPGNMNQLVDLEYRLENERDPDKREELLEEFSKIVEKSSTGLCTQALLALNDGDLDRAATLCEQAIEKFPDNTIAYKLKHDVHQAIARKTIEEGLRREPRDRVLRLASEIEDQLWKVREKCANGLLDPEVAIRHLERLVQEKIEQEGIELELYKKEVEKSLKATEVIQPRTMKFLCTGEFLLSQLHKPLDYAPSAIEFCKAIENELHDRLFKPFKSWCLKNLPDLQATHVRKEASRLFEFIYKDKRIALGEMTMIFQFLGSRKRLKENKLFQMLKNFIERLFRPEFLLGTDGTRSVLTPKTVNMYRNSAAHLSEFDLKKAQDTKRWCYKILNLLSKA